MSVYECTVFFIVVLCTHVFYLYHVSLQVKLLNRALGKREYLVLIRDNFC